MGGDTLVPGGGAVGGVQVVPAPGGGCLPRHGLEEVGWQPSESFKSGLIKTVEWNLLNRKWSEDVLIGANNKQESKNKLENK